MVRLNFFYYRAKPKAMRAIMLFSFLIPFFWSCQSSPKKEALVGNWQVDSTYTYYNGFDQVQREPGSDWATYVYDPEGMMKEIKYGSYQSYFYEWVAEDSLLVTSTNGGTGARFAVLLLNEDRLILKKDKSPVFSGAGQERYEVRYLSRTAAPVEEAMPFSDPRQQ